MKFTSFQIKCGAQSILQHHLRIFILPTLLYSIEQAETISIFLFPHRAKHNILMMALPTGKKEDSEYFAEYKGSYIEMNAI